MGPRINTTNWRLVLQAAAGDSPASREALAALCEAYWHPVYAFIRRQGLDAADAEDLTQAYFARFLEKQYLKAVRREAGRFRSFLLASVKHFLANERDRARALKRGGGQTVIPFDSTMAETRYSRSTAQGVTPEAVFERQWAHAVLEQAVGRLRAEFETSGGSDRFARLKPHLTGDESAESYRQIAVELGVTEPAVRVAIHRLRRRFGALLREEVARTVSGQREIDAEIRHLISLWRQPHAL